MYAIDTNVLVRVIVNDDQAQAKKALNYIKKHRNVFVSLVVLCETSWVLTTCYNFSKSLLVEILEALLRTKQFVFENQDIAWEAVYALRDSNADFSDCLIGTIAKSHGIKAVATFDKKAAKLHFFESI